MPADQLLLMGRGDLSFPPSAPQGRQSQDLFSLAFAPPSQEDVGFAFTQRRRKGLVGAAFSPFVWVGVMQAERPGDQAPLPRFFLPSEAVRTEATGPLAALLPAYRPEEDARLPMAPQPGEAPTEDPSVRMPDLPAALLQAPEAPGL